MKSIHARFFLLLVGLLIVGCSDSLVSTTEEGEEAFYTIGGYAFKGNARIVASGDVGFLAGRSESPNRPIKHRSFAFELLDATDTQPVGGGVRFTVLNEDSSLHRETTILLGEFHREGKSIWLIGDVLTDIKYGGGNCSGGCDHGDDGGCDHGDDGGCDHGDDGGCDHGDDGDDGGCDHGDDGSTDSGGCDHDDTDGTDSGGCDHDDTDGTDSGGCSHDDTGDTDSGGCSGSGGSDDHGGGSDCQGGACGHSGGVTREGNIFMAKFVDGGTPARIGDVAAWKWKIDDGIRRPDITHHDNWRLCTHEIIDGNIVVRDW